jgi:peptidoglycan/LPS O-acetylase OafA/YrhL
LLLLPVWTLPMRWGSYMPLNPPAWSLFWEYAANIAYGVILWRLSNRVLAAITLSFGIGIVISGFLNMKTGLSLGWSWENIYYAPIRVGFSFGAGILLFRLGAALRSPLGFAALSAALIGVFVFPYTMLNWVYEAVAILLLFPLIVAIGAGARENRWTAGLCAFSGRLSYPLYILHYPFVSVFANYHWGPGFPKAWLPAIIALFTLCAVAVAWLALVLFDEPVRHRLKTRFAFPLKSSGAASAGSDELAAPRTAPVNAA